jgi:hypothetical protein
MVEQLKEECERVLPLLQDSHQLARRHNTDHLGLSQANELRGRSDNECAYSSSSRVGGLVDLGNHRRIKIKRLQEDITRMASELDISVGRPPSLSSS